jgi:hypothetical protein
MHGRMHARQAQDNGARALTMRRPPERMTRSCCTESRSKPPACSRPSPASCQKSQTRLPQLGLPLIFALASCCRDPCSGACSYFRMEVQSASVTEV